MSKKSNSKTIAIPSKVCYSNCTFIYLSADISASGISPFPGRQGGFRKESLLKYEEFIEYIKGHLSAYFEPDTTIIIHRVLKNNNTELDGISVLKKDQNISPTLYLNDYYEEYLFGTPVEQLLEELYHNFLHPYTGFQFSVADFKKFRLMKDKIVYRLIHYESNKTLLSEVPHQKFLDLAIVYYVMLHSDENGNASIMVRNEHMKFWNITQETLHQYAKKNSPLLLPARIQPIEEIIQGGFLPSEADIAPLFPKIDDDYKPAPMYVMTNAAYLNGAAVLLYENALSSFASSLQENFYILPSSIHEVILLTANGSFSKENLELMVKDINQKEVSPMERLSDHVYFYDHITQKITL